MTPNLQKELRTLALPAGLILAAVLAGAWATTWSGGILGYRPVLFRGALIAFFLGTPLLASLPFGSEFQHRTIVLLLSQPVSRTRIWFEKWMAAVIVLALLSGVAFTFVVLRVPEGEWPIIPALGFIVMVACSAPLWTLVARSTIGGLTFTMSVIMMLELAANYVLYRATGSKLDQEVFGRAAVLDFVRMGYAAITLCAGWLVFSRFQAVATGLGAASAGHTHTGWAVLRARRSGAIANLVRKELILQRPAFLVAVLFAIGWFVSVALFGAGMLSPRFAETLAAILLAGHIPLVIVLAGTVPLGEDTALGLRDWHLTLPIPARIQWAIKLLVAIAVVALLALVVPALFTYAASRLTSGRIAGIARYGSPSFQLLVVGAVMLAFWCSTMFGDTLKASVATGAAVLGVALCSASGYQLGDWMRIRQPWWHWLIVHYQLPPHIFTRPWVFAALVGGAFAVALAVGFSQSYQAFRQVRVSRRMVWRNCAVLFVTVLVALTLVSSTMSATSPRSFAPSRELRQALIALPAPATPTERRHRTVTLDGLQRVRELSPDTRRWLANTTIAIDDMTMSAHPQYCATVHFPNGREYRVVY
jgi:hypothetical protein